MNTRTKLAPAEPAFTLLENGLPTPEGIERWRQWTLCCTRSENAEYINQLFHCARLGRARQVDARLLAKTELVGMLRSLARQIDTRPPKAAKGKRTDSQAVEAAGGKNDA